MRRLALEKSSAPKFADELTIARGDFSAHGDNMRATFDLETFKGIVIDVHEMRLRGNFSAIVWIVDDEIRIAADLDRTFARKKAEQFCRAVLAVSTNRFRSMRPRFTPCVK